MGDFFCRHLRNFEQRIHNKVTKLQDNTCDDHDNQTEEVTDKVRNRRKRNASGHCKCKNNSSHGTLNGFLSFYGFTFYKRVNVAHLLSIKKTRPITRTSLLAAKRILAANVIAAELAVNLATEFISNLHQAGHCNSSHDDDGNHNKTFLVSLNVFRVTG